MRWALALWVVAACGRLRFDAVVDADIDATPLTCSAGLTQVANVLVDGDFESSLCSYPTIGGWTVMEAGGWIEDGSKPIVADGGGCGLSGYGCGDWMSTNWHGLGCLEVFGDYQSPVAASAEVHQTFHAPRPIQRLRLGWARATGQFVAGWRVELRYQIGGMTSTVDSIVDQDVNGSFVTTDLTPSVQAPDVDVIVHMERTGAQAGYGWAFVDTVGLDVCY